MLLLLLDYLMQLLFSPNLCTAVSGEMLGEIIFYLTIFSFLNVPLYVYLEFSFLYFFITLYINVNKEFSHTHFSVVFLPLWHYLYLHTNAILLFFLELASFCLLDALNSLCFNWSIHL